MVVFFSGLFAGLGLIVAIGAQNSWVLRQGLRAEHIAPIVAICIASDAVLIAAGTLGTGSVMARAPWLPGLFCWAGAAYLCWFGARLLLSALRPGSAGLGAGGSMVGRGLRSTVLTTLAFTWLNPHVYLDTMILLGALASAHAGQARWLFAAGAASASALWFSGLGFGAARLSGPLGRPTVWRWLDVVIGLTMLGIAARLVLSRMT